MSITGEIENSYRSGELGNRRTGDEQSLGEHNNYSTKENWRLLDNLRLVKCWS